MPTTNTPAQINPEEDPWGVPPQGISWDVEPPFTVEGTVLGQEMAQQTDITTRKPLVWDDGRPRKKVIITLQGKVDETIANDDGKRAMHVNIPSDLFRSIREAIQAAGLKTLATGVQLATTYTHQEEPERKGLSGQKKFESLITDERGQSTEPPF